VRNTESSGTGIYIGWHSILGQMKVKQRSEEAKTFWAKKSKAGRARIFIACPAPCFGANDFMPDWIVAINPLGSD